MKIAFVVLHYETNFDTEECIDSILKLKADNEQVSIIVVDNCSPNKKIGELQNKYKKNSNIKFILNEKNEGFARGNNKGFMYAKNEIKPDIIILANNDTLIEDEDFVVNLVHEYKFNKFDVAGPKIISMQDNQNQNPVMRQYYSEKDIYYRINKFNVLLLLSHLNMDVFFQKIFVGLKKIFKRKSDKYNKVTDFQIHGAFMIFGKSYIEQYDGLYDKTFMYGEENILKYICIRDGLVMKYLDSICVYHKEGSSTQNVFGKKKEKRQFYYENNIQGCKSLLNLMRLDK